MNFNRACCQTFLGLMFLCYSPFSLAAETLDYIRIMVNHEIMTHHEVQSVIAGIKNELKNNISDPAERERQLTGLEKTTMENLINELLLLDRAKQLKLDVSNEEIDRRREQILESSPGILKQFTEDDLQELINKDLLKQKLLSQEVDYKIVVSPDDLKNYCLNQLGQGQKKLGIAQILLRSTDKEAQAKAQQISHEFKAGKSFEDLALQYSADPNVKRNQGRMGLMAQGEALAEIDKVAFALKPGELSQLVKTEFGYHILYIYESKGGNSNACDQLTTVQEERIHNALYAKKRESVLRDYLTDLHKTAQILVRN